MCSCQCHRLWTMGLWWKRGNGYKTFKFIVCACSPIMTCLAFRAFTFDTGVMDIVLGDRWRVQWGWDSFSISLFSVILAGCPFKKFQVSAFAHEQDSLDVKVILNARKKCVAAVKVCDTRDQDETAQEVCGFGRCICSLREGTTKTSTSNKKMCLLESPKDWPVRVNNW